MTILQDLEAARDALEESERIRKLGMEPDVNWESLRDARRESIARTEAALSRLRARLEQVDAEPVAWRFHDGKTWCYVNHITDLSSSPKFFPLYTSPTPAAAPMPAGWEIEPTASGYTVTPPQPGCGGRHVTPDSDNHADQLLYSLAYAIYSALEKPQKGGKAPKFDSAPQVSRNPQTRIKPAVDVDSLQLPERPAPHHHTASYESSGFIYYTTHDMDAYARAALRMHLTGGK